MSRPQRPLLVNDASHIGVWLQLQLAPHEPTLSSAQPLGATRRLPANAPQLPDGLLLDSHLPDGFGLDSLTGLRAPAATRALPRIVPAPPDSEPGRHLSTALLHRRAP